MGELSVSGECTPSSKLITQDWHAPFICGSSGSVVSQGGIENVTQGKPSSPALPRDQVFP